MPARSPHRHSPIPIAPAPPRITRRTPPPSSSMKQERSLERKSGGSSRRGRGGFRNESPPPPQHRRSRSPMRHGDPKGPPREFGGIQKRKLSPPPLKKSRRDEGRRPVSPDMKPGRSKSPGGRERSGPPRIFGNMPGHSGSYSNPSGDGQRLTRTVDSGNRFREGNYQEPEEGTDRPIFRGPESTDRFDPGELKRIRVEIVRRNLLPPESQVINRAIVNAEDIAPVRRPEIDYGEQMGRMREPPPPPRHRSISPSHSSYQSFSQSKRPLSSWWNDSAAPPVDNYSRRDSMDYTNRERPRARSPGSSRDPHNYTYSGEKDRERERERSPFDSRDKRSDRYHSDLRHELDQRRRDAPSPHHYHSSEFRDSSGGYRGSARESESDLRSRISEKRSEPHYRQDDRERDRDRHEMERERNRGHRSPPPPPHPRERSRGSHELRPISSRSDREGRDKDTWERERERDMSERKRRARSRDLEDDRRGGGSRRHSSVERFIEGPERKERPYSSRPVGVDRPSERELLHERSEFSGSHRGGRGGHFERRGGMPPMIPRGMPPRFRPIPMAVRVPPPFFPIRGGRPMMRPFPLRIFPPPFRPFFM